MTQTKMANVRTSSSQESLTHGGACFTCVHCYSFSPTGLLHTKEMTKPWHGALHREEFRRETEFLTSDNTKRIKNCNILSTFLKNSHTCDSTRSQKPLWNPRLGARGRGSALSQGRVPGPLLGDSLGLTRLPPLFIQLMRSGEQPEWRISILREN